MKRFKDLLQEFLDKTLDGFEHELESLEDPIKFADDKTFEQDFYSVDLGLGEIIKIAEKTNPKIKYAAVKEYLDSKDRHEELGNEVIYAFAVDGNTKIANLGKDNLRYVSQIIATAIASIKMYLKGEQPTLLTFTADGYEPSRVKVYDTIFKKSSMPGYKLVKFTDKSGTQYNIMKDHIYDRLKEVERDLEEIQYKHDQIKGN